MASSIQTLLTAMIEERKKSKSDEDDDFILVQDIDSHWPDLFHVYFLSKPTRLAQTSTCTTSDDDLVFYVKRKSDSDTIHPLSLVQVFRHHDTKRQPKLGAAGYDWEETTNLNLILHQFDYTVTAAVCIKQSSKHIHVLKRLSTRVYASPSRRNMATKGTEEKISYPDIFFTVDNFEDKFCELYINEGEMVCVELVAKNPHLSAPKVLFLGSIKYDALKRVYDDRATNGGRVGQRMTLGNSNKNRVEFVRMRGPSGKGHAEMAVSRHRSTQSGVVSPESTPSTPVSTQSNDEDSNKQQTVENGASLPSNPPTPPQNQTTPEVESNDSQEELIDPVGGIFGRTLNQAMNWVRGSSTRSNSNDHGMPLQTCLTYLTLPCQMIVKDILESDSVPLLTSQ